MPPAFLVIHSSGRLGDYCPDARGVVPGVDSAVGEACPFLPQRPASFAGKHNLSTAATKPLPAAGPYVRLDSRLAANRF
jgi:hypothetical protein